jgi:single-stranded-DNA-specific exonuclease
MSNTSPKIWNLAKRTQNNIIDQLLLNRKVVDVDGIDEAKKETFFHPDFLKDLYDPMQMMNLDGACRRISLAAENKEKIGIFADYDADGIPGAALLYRTLSQIGIKCEVFIPNREGGYGLSQEGIDFLKKNKCSLLITVDMGIRNIDEAKYCKSLDLELIITDHHLPGDILPDANIVINPKQVGDEYPYKELCGCGVVYKLAQGLSKYFPKQIDEKFLKWNLDLVAISTISDVVPLTEENRVLAKYGLVVIRKTKNIGLKALIDVAKLAPNEISAYHLGFQIGPRINAPGRLHSATKSFELLVSKDEEESRQLALWLDQKNEDRQLLMEKTQNEAISIADEKSLIKNKIIIVAGNWQKGVIGPSASKLVEKYGRPVILFAEDGETLTGSARSISGINIVELFERCSKTIKKFGGHKGAAGITVTKEMYPKFENLILAEADKVISDEMLLPKINVDVEVSTDEITKELHEKLCAFEPFGMGNPRPVFISLGIHLLAPRFVGQMKNHLSASVKSNHQRLKVIFFNFPYDTGMISENEKYDIVFTVSMDEWQGQKNLSLSVLDIRIHRE